MGYMKRWQIMCGILFFANDDNCHLFIFLFLFLLIIIFYSFFGLFVFIESVSVIRTASAMLCKRFPFQAIRSSYTEFPMRGRARSSIFN